MQLVYCLCPTHQQGISQSCGFVALRPKVPHSQPGAWKGRLRVGAPSPHCCPWAVLAVQWPAVILANSVLGTTRSALQLEPGQLEVGAHFPFPALDSARPTGQ